MPLNDYTDKAVLVTGGTKGIGLAIALAFGARGAHCYLTYKWGSADLDSVAEAFKQAEAPEPVIIEADAGEDEDTVKVIEAIAQDHDAVELLVSNVAFALVTKGGFDDYKLRSMLQSLNYSTWPMVGYFQEIERRMGNKPRYVLGISSDAPDTYIPGYDFAAVTKATMETFCKYMATQLLDDDCRVNVLRARGVITDSLEATFGPEFEPFHRKYFGDRFFVTCEEVADAALALCSGLMDGVSGQVIQLDKGVAFCDNLYRLFEHREEYGL